MCLLLIGYHRNMERLESLENLWWMLSSQVKADLLLMYSKRYWNVTYSHTHTHTRLCFKLCSHSFTFLWHFDVCVLTFKISKTKKKQYCWSVEEQTCERKRKENILAVFVWLNWALRVWGNPLLWLYSVDMWHAYIYI